MPDAELMIRRCWYALMHPAACQAHTHVFDSSLKVSTGVVCVCVCVCVMCVCVRMHIYILCMRVYVMPACVSE